MFFLFLSLLSSEGQEACPDTEQTEGLSLTPVEGVMLSAFQTLYLQAKKSICPYKEPITSLPNAMFACLSLDLQSA